jgi:hypothetical protein
VFKLLFDKSDSKLEELLFLLSIIVVSLLFDLDLFTLEIKELDIFSVILGSGRTLFSQPDPPSWAP